MTITTLFIISLITLILSIALAIASYMTRSYAFSILALIAIIIRLISLVILIALIAIEIATIKALTLTTAGIIVYIILTLKLSLNLSKN